MLLMITVIVDRSDLSFVGKAKVKLENKGDLSFFAKQDEAVSPFKVTFYCKDYIWRTAKRTCRLMLGLKVSSHTVVSRGV